MFRIKVKVSTYGIDRIKIIPERKYE